MLTVSCLALARACRDPARNDRGRNRYGGNAMKTWDAIMIGTVTAGALLLAGQALAQGADGVPGDRLVVPLPDVSALSDDQARELTRELAEANVISENCPDYTINDGEWQLLNGTSDALTAQLGLDPLAYDREFFRPAFNLLDDPAACDTRGPEVAQLIERLVAMGGDTQPDLPEPAETEAEAEAETEAPAEPPAEQPAE